MFRYQHKESRITKNQVNITPPKKSNKSPITGPKGIQIYKLTTKNSE